MKKVSSVIYLVFVSMLFFGLFFSCASSPPLLDMAAGSSNFEFGETVSRTSDGQTEERMITYSASLELAVKNTDETRKKINEQITNNKGFVVRETENTIVARIPSANMDEYLNYARTLGKVERESRTGTDITDQYRDNVLGLDNLKNVRNRYISLLDQANTVNDILSIEKELERVNFEIERLEGRIQNAQQSVAYSTITVRFRERTRPGPVGWIFYGLFQGVKWLFVWD